ncbi:indoleamine 2,3-dioxygenase [Rhizoctonia solani]|uniref:Indoleamine 2,3-dioxygenase n=1 Tax=Rhizoctonia solani TaxID=456999 RepID=A0A8H8SV93_9AGAM|nr:indoleamine 2,3-dioxygenase [Rhizoctonia solani]QRW17908.1 indoleamine 2,3-dioxygenase [Rhizoctonia solani]
MNALVKLFGLMGITSERPSGNIQDDYQLPESSPDMTSLACPEFGLDSKTGFLPTQVPLARLPAAFNKWEDALQQAMVILKRPGDSDDPPPTDEEREQSSRWRENLRTMEVISIDPLQVDLRVAQRAHHVLAFLVQFYVQSLPPRAETELGPIHIPRSLAIPFVDVSRYLDIAPILTYADCVLWNFYLEDPSKPLTLENIRIRDLFTKDYQEEHFFLTSARIEIRGFEAIQLMGDAIAMTRKAQNLDVVVDEIRLQSILARLAIVIDDLNQILWSVKDACGYQFFYWVFRPVSSLFRNGYGSPKWLYEGVDGEGIEFQCSGPSAGQAALMHAFDVFLGIGHPQKDDRYSPACTGMRIHPSYDPHGNSQACPASSTSSASTNACPVTGESSPSFADISDELRSFLLEEAAYPTPPAEKTELSITLPLKPLSLERSLNLPTPPSSPMSRQFGYIFIVRMRKYIPGNHQKFLLHLAHSSVRPHVAVCASSGVRRAYNDCVWAIKRFRDTHIKIVTLYVIHPARSKVLVKDTDSESAPVRGTGGTSLVPLLKAYRNNTANTMFQTD